MTQNVFSYGTLQRDSVQIDNFGRRLEGRPDALIGYQIVLIPIQDQEVVLATGETNYRNIQFTGAASDVVEGTVFTVTSEELERADQYEADADYARVMVELRSGVKAWVYLNPAQS
jgi:gamma-glutamylcyclotransferase (GGCT)/AIG2-like uncharacterized protein YtfP